MNPAAASPGRLALRRFRRQPWAMVGLAFLLLAAAVALLGPGLSGVDPDQGSESPFAPPDARHWMGTDIHGRDLLARMMVGTRISLMVGAFGAAVSLGIGVGWGMVSGWRGGRTDAGMMRLVDVLDALPTVVWVMLVLTIFETRCVGWLSERWTASIPALRLPVAAHQGIWAEALAAVFEGEDVEIEMVQPVRRAAQSTADVVLMRTRSVLGGALAPGTARVMQQEIDDTPDPRILR